MDLVFPKIALPLSPPVKAARPHVSFSTKVCVQEISADGCTVSVHQGTLRAEGPSATINERTALLPPPVTHRARMRMAHRRRLRVVQATRHRQSATLTGAAVGTVTVTALWVIAALHDGGESPFGVGSVGAMLACGAAFGGCIGLLVEMQSRADATLPRDMLYDV